MSDARIENLAKLLVRYSLRARREELIAVNSTTLAEPLVLAVYEELLRVGAWPVLHMSPARTTEVFYRCAQPHHLDRASPVYDALSRLLHGSLYIEASHNTRALSEVDPRLQVRVSRATRAARERMIRKKWCLTLYPTAAHAQDAEMSLEAFEDFVFAATFADQDDPIGAWRQLAQEQRKLVARLRGADRIRILGADTDLTLSVKNRVFVSSDGHHNMPSGEIFTAPLEDSAEGHIRFEFPVAHAGRLIEDVRLVFRRGRVVEATARKNEEFLRAALETDAGARRLGELGIGTNYRITRFTRNILFDEKIGGTIHLALGRSYEETGGRNRSALHWDMIKDLRQGGALYVDDRPFLKDGKIVGV